MFGLPAKELKAVTEHADKTLTSVDATLVDVRTFLRVITGIAEDVRAVTQHVRQLVTKP
jgi:hypothetical protein